MPDKQLQPEREATDGSAGLSGLVDLQVNGGFGIDLLEDPDRLGELAALLPGVGVGTFLATLPSPNFEQARRLSDAYLRVVEEANPSAARVAGIHLEGPAIARSKAGAHPLERIAPPHSVVPFLELPGVKMITLAPEIPGSYELAAEASARGIVVAAGHTEGSVDDGQEAIERGICLLTHAFNAMRPIDHRDPGLVTAYLTDDRARVTLISDGTHVAPAVIRLTHALKRGRIALVSDAVAAMDGNPDRPAPLSGRNTRPYGGGIGLKDCVLRYSAITGIGIEEAVAAAKTVPEQILGSSATGQAH